VGCLWELGRGNGGDEGEGNGWWLPYMKQNRETSCDFLRGVWRGRGGGDGGADVTNVRCKATQNGTMHPRPLTIS
jgi:hypothetical protein